MLADAPDRLLDAYLSAAEPDEVELQLARILDEVARPIIRRVVASVYASGAGTASTHGS